jgi:hypothetical protein
MYQKRFDRLALTELPQHDGRHARARDMLERRCIVGHYETVIRPSVAGGSYEVHGMCGLVNHRRANDAGLPFK